MTRPACRPLGELSRGRKSSWRLPTASYETDARIARADKTLARSNYVLPEFKRIHRMGANLPQECVRFTTHEFTSLIFWTNYNVPTYAKWLQEEANLAPTTPITGCSCSSCNGAIRVRHGY